MILDRNSEINGYNDSTIEYVVKSWLGTVVDPSDPEFRGACRIRVHGVFDEIPDEDLPWAYPGANSTYFGTDGAGSISIPKKGALVVVKFHSGDIYSPEYFSIQELSKDLHEQLATTGQKDAQGNTDYLGSHYIIWDGDEQLKLWFTTKQGLTFENKQSRINFAQDSKITIEHKETQSIIELEGPTINIVANSTVDITATSEVRVTSDQIWLRGDFTRVGASGLTEPAVMGEALVAVLSSLASMIDGKAPSTPGLAKGVVEMAKSVLLSDTVTVGK